MKLINHHEEGNSSSDTFLKENQFNAAVFQLRVSFAFFPSDISQKEENQLHKFISISSSTSETN